MFGYSLKPWDFCNIKLDDLAAAIKTEGRSVTVDVIGLRGSRGVLVRDAFLNRARIEAVYGVVFSLIDKFRRNRSSSNVSVIAFDECDFTIEAAIYFAARFSRMGLQRIVLRKCTSLEEEVPEVISCSAYYHPNRGDWSQVESIWIGDHVSFHENALACITSEFVINNPTLSNVRLRPHASILQDDDPTDELSACFLQAILDRRSPDQKVFSLQIAVRNEQNAILTGAIISQEHGCVTELDLEWGTKQDHVWHILRSLESNNGRLELLEFSPGVAMIRSDWKILLDSLENNKRLQLKNLRTGHVYDGPMPQELKDRATKIFKDQLSLEYIDAHEMEDLRFFALRNRIDESIEESRELNLGSWTVTERAKSYAIEHWDHWWKNDPSVDDNRRDAEVLSGIFHLLQSKDGIEDLIAINNNHRNNQLQQWQLLASTLEKEDDRAPKRLYLGVIDGVKWYSPKWP